MAYRQPHPHGGATRVRGQARSVLRPSGPPTTPISVRATGDRISEWHTRAVIDFTLRLGEAMLVTGASVADTTTAVLRVCRAYGMTSVHADITYSSVTISFHRGVHRDPITVMRIISRFGTDYSRLESLHKLVREICADPADPGDIQDNLHELEYILDQPHAYRRGVVALAYAGMGGAVAAQLGADWLLVVVIAFSTVCVHQAQVRIARMGVSAFFGQVVGAMIASGVAVFLLFLRQYAHQWHIDFTWLQEFHQSVIVASNIVVLLAGMSVVTAAQDTLDGFYVTASARTYEVIMLTGGVVAGIVLMLAVSTRLGLQLPVIPVNRIAPTLTSQVIASAFVAAFFAVSAFCGPITIGLSFVIGGASFGMFSVMVYQVGWSQPVASGLAAFVIGAFAPWLARTFHVPSVALSTASVTPLLPGFLVYKGIMLFIQDKSVTQTSMVLSTAVLVALALAVGSSLGTLLGRQLTTNGSSSIGAKVLQRTVAPTHADE